MKYRAEIDGLRAIALMPVVFFHAGFRLFSGGYVGVDVFFVISGFLIASMLIEDMTAGTFSLLRFYERRARRILPALFLVIACCAPFAWFLMFPLELRDFAGSVLSVCLFASNIFFWSKSGYFAQAAQLTPLLHTWSLAVEEQYYLLFPILLYGLFGLGRGRAFAAIVIVAILSFILFVVSARYDPNMSFFSAPTRAWEILAGSICAFVAIEPDARRDNWLSLLGLALIVFRVFIHGDLTPVLSVYSLAPVIGAALIILYGRQDTWVGKLLSHRILVGIGLISYSAYLWHQPLFVFARIVSIPPPGAITLIAVSATSLLLGYVSWRFVERPFRERGARSYVGGASMVGFACVGSAALIVAGLWAYLSEGFPQRIPGEVLAIAGAASDINFSRGSCFSGQPLDQQDLAPCRLGVADATPDFVLLGDSFARALADGMNSAALKRRRAGLVIGLPGCPPIAAIGGIWALTRAQCPAFQRSLAQIVSQLGVSTAILYANWTALDRRSFIAAYSPNATNGADAFREPLIATLSDLASRHVKVFVICCSPELTFPIPQALARIKLLGSPVDIRPYKREFLDGNRTAFSLFSSPEVSRLAELIDISDFFCHSDRCDLSLNGRPLFSDQSHLSRFGAESLSPWLERIFDEKR